MRIKINFSIPKGISIPVNYNHMLQSIFYNLIKDKDFNRQLHEEGYKVGMRPMKLFTFSRFMGNSTYNKSLKMLFFDKKISWVISSPIEEIIKNVMNGLDYNKSIFIAGQELKIQSIEWEMNPHFGNSIQVQTISPLTMHRTLDKKTTYLESNDKDFQRLIKQNLARKFTALGQTAETKDLIFHITPLSKEIKQVVFFEETPITAWLGLYRLDGDPKVIKMAYEAGIGARNSGGFGCLKAFGRR